jgi:thiamine-phosphate diphosphorylase
MLPRPALIAITDVACYGEAVTLRVMLDLCRAAHPGSVAIQLRDHELPAASRLRLARDLRDLSALHGQHLLVNDRLDIAALSGADGLHLGDASVATEDARAVDLCPLVAARGLWITRAWHAGHADPDTGADAYLVSPIAAERKGVVRLGWDGLTIAVQRAASRPVYALGGMGPAEIGPALSRGAAGIAAIGAVYERPMALLDALDVRRRPNPGPQ